MLDLQASFVLAACALGVCLIAALGAIFVVLMVTSSLLKQVRLQTEAARSIETARFEFEKRVAFVRVRLERAAAYWKRKAEFAERSLASFHQVELLLSTVRERQPGATRSFSDYRSVRQVLDQHGGLLQDLTLQRHTAFALFGTAGAALYERAIDLFREVRNASFLLVEGEIIERNLSSETRTDLEGKIWANPSGPDPVAEQMSAILTGAQDVFGAALAAPFNEAGLESSDLDREGSRNGATG